MKNLINNRWLLLDYFNSTNLEKMNGQIAKYILENPNLFEDHSLIHIGQISPFSESSLSRFFNTVCSISFPNFKKNDLEEKKQFKSKINSISNIRNEFNHIMKQLENISDLSISENDIYWLSHKILSSRKVLILGHSSVLGTSFALQSLLLYFNKLVYVPYNYSSQIQLINEMNKSDLIITHNLSFDWMDSSIVDACKFELKDINSSCVSISISTDSARSNPQINYSRVIQLSKKESLLSESIFSLFYKLVTIYCFILLNGDEDSESNQM